MKKGVEFGEDVGLDVGEKNVCVAIYPATPPAPPPTHPTRTTTQPTHPHHYPATPPPLPHPHAWRFFVRQRRETRSGANNKTVKTERRQTFKHVCETKRNVAKRKTKRWKMQNVVQTETR